MKRKPNDDARTPSAASAATVELREGGHDE